MQYKAENWVYPIEYDTCSETVVYRNYNVEKTKKIYTDPDTGEQEERNYFIYDVTELTWDEYKAYLIDKAKKIAALTFVNEVQKENSIYDEVIILEHADLFSLWDDKWTGKRRTILRYENKVYKTLQNIGVEQLGLNPVENPEIYELIGDTDSKESLINIEILRRNKLREIAESVEQTIYKGIELETSKGVRNFSLTLEDQKNIMAMTNIALGGDKVLYHADKYPCIIFEPEEFLQISKMLTAYIIYQTTLCNFYNTWIRRVENPEEFEKIVYGEPLPNDLKNEDELTFNDLMAVMEIPFRADIKVTEEQL